MIILILFYYFRFSYRFRYFNLNMVKVKVRYVVMKEILLDGCLVMELLCDMWLYVLVYVDDIILVLECIFGFFI